MLVNDGKLHLMYALWTEGLLNKDRFLTGGALGGSFAPDKGAGQKIYVRYDLETGKEDLRVSPVLKGETIALGWNVSGFFAASRSSRRGSPLYCISADVKGRIVSLVSYDKGKTWNDHAVSNRAFAPYSVGGCNVLTDDGFIIGSFTDLYDSRGQIKPSVYFFRIPTQRK